MFDRLFVRPTALARHRDGPLAQERLAYLAHLAEQGMSVKSLRAAAGCLLVVVCYLRLADRPGEVFRLDEIERHAARWAKRRSSKLSRKGGGTTSREVFLWRATDWLRFLGRLKQEPTPTCRCGGMIDAFADYMRRERGLSPETIYNRCCFARRFLDRLGTRDGSLCKMTIARIDAALLKMLGSGDYARTAVKVFANHLRAFFRFAEMRGWCRKGLADAIQGPRIYTFALLPTGPSWNDVQRLLATTEGDDPADIRDRAILMLFAIYGLRAGEVKRLRLEDLDWELERITVSGSKTRRTRTYPLSHSVGDAILRYLKAVRRSSIHREVFLALQSPIQPMRQLSGVVIRRWQRLGLPVYGPHALRHACAAHLLTQGLSMKEIGDHLGHHNPDSTRIYAKVDLLRLRQVADFDMGGLR